MEERRPSDEELPALHRYFAASLFNRVWDLLEEPDRSDEQDDEMLHAAHASRYHWGVIGEPVTLVRGEWQVSRVYAVLKRGREALHHAERSLTLCRQYQIEGFDLAFAYEAMARAQAVLEDPAARDQFERLARSTAESIADAQDREWLLQNLASIP